MVNPCSDGFCLIYHYDDPYDGSEGRTEPICYKNRAIYDHVVQPNGTYISVLTGGYKWGWWYYLYDTVTSEESYATLEDYRRSANEWGAFNDYFTIDPATRSRCFSPSPSPSPSPSFGGNASPPPPPPRKMCGCDCNTISSIMAEYMAEKQRLLDAIKLHVDQRTIEQLQQINKMLQDMNIDLDLQPVIDRLNQVEANLWNGIGGGG
jgi:hypothetical protein